VTRGDLVAVFLVQAAVLFVPLALDLTGLISGAAAGFASTTAWFLLGVPLSYLTADRRAERRARQEGAERAMAARLRVDHALRS
jgi:hypothetical protein